MNLSAVKTWSSGETLTAADLNAEFTNIYNHTITNDDIDTTDSYVLGELVVGSGISAADGGQLHVHTASAGTIQASADADEAVVENSAAAGITILSGNTSTGNLHFGDDGDNDIGKIVYDHSANTLTLTAGATAVAALAAGSFVVNEGSADIDTRVESNGLSHALYVDGGKDALVVGANSDVSSTDTPFLIDYAARTATAATNFDRAKVAGTNAITIPAGTTTLVTGLHVAEPNLTATGTITSAASLYVAAAPTEASANYALWVDAGATQLDGTLGVTGLTTATGGVTSGGNVISDSDSTDDLGTTSVRWANLYVDSIGDTGQALALTAGTNAISLTAGDVTIFDDNNNADTSLSIGTSATEALKVEVLNGAANKTAEEVRFTTSTASATADHGKMSFYVDDAQIATIDDGGIDLAAGLAFTVNGAAVGLTFNNDANNRVVTGDGSGGLNGEANLTFDGSTLTVTGTIINSGMPAFLAKNTQQDNVTGDGTTYTVNFDSSEIFDRGSDFDGTATFTAPVTGIYMLGYDVSIRGITSSHTSSQTNIVTSNRSYQISTDLAAVTDVGGGAAYDTHRAQLVDMDAADTAVIQLTVAGGTKVIDIEASSVTSHFYGYLVG